MNHVAVLRAEGRETRGQGNANATITATLVPDGDGTAVTVLTDLVVTGRVAQFGRGVLAEVSAKLLDQFVECLEKTVLAGEGAAPVPPPTAAPAAKAPVGPPASVLTEVEATAPIEPTAPPEATAPAKSAAPGAPPRAADLAPAGDEAPAAAAVAPQPTPRPAIRKIDSPEPTPVNLLDAAGSPVAKRVGPVLAIIAVAWLLKKLFGRSK